MTAVYEAFRAAWYREKVDYCLPSLCFDCLHLEHLAETRPAGDVNTPPPHVLPRDVAPPSARIMRCKFPCVADHPWCVGYCREICAPLYIA